MHEIEKVTRRFAQELIKRDLISPSQNVPAPDIGSSSRENGLGLQMNIERFTQLILMQQAGVTGKPASKNGLEGREEATGKRCSIYCS